MPSARNQPDQNQDGGGEGAVCAGLPIWKKALFAILTLVVFFGLLELALLLFGVKPLSYEEDPYVGFSSQVPLFVEADDDSQVVTARNKLRFFNQQQFAKRKGSGVTRVFCLGGSTTYGRPYDDATSFCGWLRELLPVADPDQEWELINAGGISYASYRVAALMEELADYQPDIFVVYCGQNEFLERRTYAGIIDMPKTVRGLGALLSKTRIYSGLSRLVREPRDGSAAEGEAGQLDGEVNTILDQSVGPQDYERDGELEEQALAHYRYNMARMVDIARAGGADVIFVTPASNLRNCSPFKAQHRDGLGTDEQQQWQALFEGAQTDFTAKRHRDALAKLDQAAQIDDQHAQLHYSRGRVLDALEQFDEAKAAYWRALDEDVCPLRALSSMPDIVSEVASERGVPLVDFAKLVEDNSPQGIAGKELFLDHVHPTIDGHRMLALAIIDAMAEAEILTPHSDWSDEAIEGVAATIMGRVDPKAQGVAMRNLSKVFSWAGKMEDAYNAAKKGLELFPGDAESHYQVGNLARHLGKTDEAVKRLSYLVSVDLSADVSFYLKAHAQLSEILAERGDLAGSERVLRRLLQLDPDNDLGQQQRTKLLSDQGKQLAQDGQLAQAAQKFGEVVRLLPDDFDANLQLGVALVRAGDHESAVPVLNKLIALRKDYLPAYNNLSFVLAQLGRLDEAEQVCRQALAIDPDDEGTRKNLQLILKKKAGG